MLMRTLILLLIAGILVPLAMAAVNPGAGTLSSQGTDLQNDLTALQTGSDIDVVNHSISTTPIPEPCTLLLCGGGAAFLFGFTRQH
jgi:hypothetical protein